MTDTDTRLLFLSQMHCTGEHGKAAAWYRRMMGIDAQSACMGLSSYLNYPNDWGYGVPVTKVRELLKGVDIVVLEEGTPGHFGLSPSDLDGKIVVRDAHGSVTRRSRAELKRDWHGPTVYRTPDLAAFIDGESYYCPCTIDFGTFPHFAESMEHDHFKVAHAPSAPSIKGTDMLEKALRELKLRRKEYYTLSVHEPNTVSLYRRRDATVYFDNIADGSHYGYRGVLGVAGIEAAAMGQVVIGNFDAHRGSDMLPDTGTLLNTVSDIKDILLRLKEGEKLRTYLQSAWCSWAKATRDRGKESRRLLEWMKEQSPYSSA